MNSPENSAMVTHSEGSTGEPGLPTLVLTSSSDEIPSAQREYKKV